MLPPELPANETALRAAILDMLEALAQREEETRVLEEELSAFMGEYYARVGAPIEHLHALQREAARFSDRAEGKEPEAASSKGAMPGEDEAAAAPLREIYLDLARRCHPDRAGGGSKGRMQAVNAAWEKRDAGALLRLRFEQECEDAATAASGLQAARLSEIHQHIAEAHAAAEARRRALLAGEEYALFRRAYMARLKGEDLVSVIAERIAGETERAARRLSYLHCRARLMAEAEEALRPQEACA